MLYISPEDDARKQLDVHPSQRQAHVRPVSQRLHVVTAISNPERFFARYKHYPAFEKHMGESGVILYTVELALRDRHFEVTSASNPRHVQLRSEHVLWHKENLLNLGVSRFAPDWHYGAYIDADFLMTRPDWMMEAVHQLQHYPWVQLFTTYSDLSPSFEVYRTTPSFVKTYREFGEVPDTYLGGKTNGKVGATGGAWAFRRDAFDAVGGFLDINVVGGGDWQMAFALVGKDLTDSHRRFLSPSYLKVVDDWSRRANQFRHKVGAIDNHALHFWHGPKSKRGYYDRWKLLRDHSFDPSSDIRRDWQGVLGWTGHKPALEEGVRDYFRSRDEDDNHFEGTNR